jgi:predicted nucleotidyltransferase
MLRTIAKDFVKMKFEKTDGVMGVLLTGSASTGYMDALSDIDLEVISTEDLCRKVGGTCGSEQFRRVDVWWE